MNTKNLEQAQEWLSFQSPSLSAGLASEQDALKLYDYWRKQKGLPEFADEDEFINDDGDRVDLTVHRRKALGYDPMDSSTVEF